MNNTYNGWKNWETWNVALWISNDESFYDFAKCCKKSSEPYRSFVFDMDEMDSKLTPDGVSWRDSSLDINALNEMIKEL